MGFRGVSALAGDRRGTLPTDQWAAIVKSGLAHAD
jgi:hypothetical protein